MNNPHQRNLRKGRYSLSNQIYHITFTTKQRKPIFKNLTCARIVVNELRTVELEKIADTLAFVIMPDHVHWLMQLGDRHNLAETIRRLKAQVSIKLGGSVWQAGFYDHAIRKDENLVGVARYIIANPLRSGLVRRVGDYPHWYTIWL